MSDARDFDPRFDPAFQRGYEGVVDSPAPAAKKVVAPPAPEPLAPLTREPAPALPEQAGTAGVHDDFREGLREVELDAPRSRNPFVIALAVIAVALTTVGLVLFSRLGAIFADTQSSVGFDYVTFQVLIFAAPLIVCLGLATGIGVLFLLAARRAR